MLTQLRATKAELASRDAKLPEIVAARDAAAAELEQAKASLDGRDTAIAHLIAKHEAALAEAWQRPLDPWAAAESHLLFFQGSEGYELVERTGPPPAAGDRVDVPGRTCSSRASRRRRLRDRACPARTSSPPERASGPVTVRGGCSFDLRWRRPC